MRAFVIHQGDVDDGYGQYTGGTTDTDNMCAFVLHAKNMVSAVRLYRGVSTGLKLIG